MTNKLTSLTNFQDPTGDRKIPVVQNRSWWQISSHATRFRHDEFQGDAMAGREDKDGSPIWSMYTDVQSRTRERSVIVQSVHSMSLASMRRRRGEIFGVKQGDEFTTLLCFATFILTISEISLQGDTDSAYNSTLS